MSFERAWALLLLVLPVAWDWRRQPRHTHLLLKAGTIVAVILALSVPSLSYRARKVAVAVLVDTSASVTYADLTRESQLLKQIDETRGSNQVDVIPFARIPRPLTNGEAGFKLARTTGADGRGTNL